MDPKATLRNLIRFHHAGDVEETDECLEILADWLRNGGFPPVCNSLGSVLSIQHSTEAIILESVAQWSAVQGFYLSVKRWPENEVVHVLPHD
jgi:hypothetical protein